MPLLVEKLAQIAGSHGCTLYGFADLEGLTSETRPGLNRGVSFVVRMAPEVMNQLAKGPTQAYAALYNRVNQRIDALTAETARLLTHAGYRAFGVPASIRSDPIAIAGDFPHKTVATRAGLGWVGKNCQLVTWRWGPWVRLGSVLTDAPLVPGMPVEKSHCGQCTRCIDACPARALTGGQWYPGVIRDTLLNAQACDHYKKTHFKQYNHGHNCGICTCACPIGLKNRVGR